MQFLAPGLNQVWEAHYLPHLEKVYQEVARGNKAPAFVPPYVGDNAGTVVGYTAHGPLVLGAPLEAHTANLNVTTASSPQSLVDARSITMTPQVASALQTLGMRAN